MTAKNPEQPEPNAPKESVTPDRLLRKFRARGNETAARAEKRSNSAAIEPKKRPNQRIRRGGRRGGRGRIFTARNRLRIHQKAPTGALHVFEESVPAGAACQRDDGSNSNSLDMHRSRSAKFIAAPERRAITTKSRLSPRSRRRARNHSRIRRLKRFRTTALPTFRLAVIPIRLSAKSLARISRQRFPVSLGALKSSSFRGFCLFGAEITTRSPLA